MNTLPPALAQVMDLFHNRSTITNAEIVEELHITYRAAYDRTRRLRDQGLLASYPMWLTVNHEGMTPWRDKAGNYRTWLVFYPSRSGEPDYLQTQFDPRRNPEWKHPHLKERNHQWPYNATKHPPQPTSLSAATSS